MTVETPRVFRARLRAWLDANGTEAPAPAEVVVLPPGPGAIDAIEAQIRAALRLPKHDELVPGDRPIAPLFSATVLNPKAILFAGSIFPPAAFASVVTWLQAMAIFAVLLIVVLIVVLNKGKVADQV